MHCSLCDHSPRLGIWGSFPLFSLLKVLLRTSLWTQLVGKGGRTWERISALGIEEKGRNGFGEALCSLLQACVPEDWGRQQCFRGCVGAQRVTPVLFCILNHWPSTPGLYSFGLYLFYLPQNFQGFSCFMSSQLPGVQLLMATHGYLECAPGHSISTGSGWVTVMFLFIP